MSLTIFIDGAVPDDAEALCDEVEHLHISRDGEAVHVALHSNLHPRVVRLVWHDGASNAVVIMDHDRLAQLAKADRTSAHTPMAALLLAGDSEIVAILQELLVSTHDLQRLIQGRSTPTDQEEASESTENDPVVEISSLDFSSHRRQRCGWPTTTLVRASLLSCSSTAGDSETPRHWCRSSSIWPSAAGCSSWTSPATVGGSLVRGTG